MKKQNGILIFLNKDNLSFNKKIIRKFLKNKKINTNFYIKVVTNLREGINYLKNNNTLLSILDFETFDSDVEPNPEVSVLAGYLFASEIPVIGFLKDYKINYADRIKNFKVKKYDPLTATADMGGKEILVENFDIPLNLMLTESTIEMVSNIEEALEKITQINQIKEMFKKKLNEVGKHKFYNKEKFEGIYTAGPSVFIYKNHKNSKDFYNSPFEFKENLKNLFKEFKINYPADGIVKNGIFDNPEKWYKNKKKVAWEIFKADMSEMNNSDMIIADLQPWLNNKKFEPSFTNNKIKHYQSQDLNIDSGTGFELGYMIKLKEENVIKEVVVYNLFNKRLEKYLKNLNVNILSSLGEVSKFLNNNYSIKRNHDYSYELK